MAQKTLQNERRCKKSHLLSFVLDLVSLQSFFELNIFDHFHVLILCFITSALVNVCFRKEKNMLIAQIHSYLLGSKLYCIY